MKIESRQVTSWFSNNNNNRTACTAQQYDMIFCINFPMFFFCMYYVQYAAYVDVLSNVLSHKKNTLTRCFCCCAGFPVIDRSLGHHELNRSGESSVREYVIRVSFSDVKNMTFYVF